MVQIKISLSARRLTAAAPSPVSLHFPCLHSALNKPSPETNIQTLGGDRSPSHTAPDLGQPGNTFPEPFPARSWWHPLQPEGAGTSTPATHTNARLLLIYCLICLFCLRSLGGGGDEPEEKPERNRAHLHWIAAALQTVPTTDSPPFCFL